MAGFASEEEGEAKAGLEVCQKLTPQPSAMLPLSLSHASSCPPKTLITKTLPKTLTPPLLRSRYPIRKPCPHPKFLCCSSSQISPIQVADLVEKDYSFLDSDSTGPRQSRIVAAAGIGENSKVLISFPTVGFVDRVAGSGNCELIVAVHESLFVLAMIKEMNDAVRCLQGGILDVVPEKFLPFDVVFACYLPGLGVSLDELMGSAAKWCSPGARLVISFDQGRGIIEQEHRKLYPDIVTSSLPDKIALEKAASDHSFQITEFVDEPDLYLAVLKAI